MHTTASDTHENRPGGALADAAARMLEAIRATARELPGVWTDLAFDSHAVEVFHAQYGQVEAYRAWCDHELAARGGSPQDVRRWHQVPALPIAAFKRMRVAAQEVADDGACWHSSGTTGEGTSRHALPDTALYDASLLAGARAALVPDGGALAEPLLAVQLHPSAQDAPHGSLSHMLDLVRRELCLDGGCWAAADGTIDVDGAWRQLEHACAEDRPVLVLATSFALVHLLDQTAAREALVLPGRSRVMDTGGYKGRTRELARADLVELVGDRLGVPAGMFENEYGMSELSSQAWLGTVAASVGRPLPGCEARDGRRWQPPWMRTRVVDPATLEQVGEGETGLLVHHDLANSWTCAAIRSEDRGVRRGDGYELVGRAPGAELRGCSLQIEDLLA